MNPTIVIVDYGAGNLRSVEKAFERLGYPAVVSGEPDILLNADGVILPGVGSSGSAMAALEERGLVEPLVDKAEGGTPFFGVCLGLQLLMNGSDEDNRPCLGLFPGWVRRIPSGLKVPHMGWNRVHIKQEHPVFSGVDNDSYFYFVHSYYTDPTDDTLIVGTTDYGVKFCSVLASGNLIATQFHPEKSGEIGLKLYENFVRMVILKEDLG